MRGSSGLEVLTFVDCLLGFCIVASMATHFLELECKARGQKFLANVARKSYYLIPMLMAAFSDEINRSIFQFYGVSGLFSALLLSYAIFSIIPLWIVEWIYGDHVRISGARSG